MLINNAGVQTFGTVESTLLEQWNATIGVNLTGVYLVSRFIIPEMRRRGSGTVVNVASIHGLTTTANVAAYAASKGGVIALSRSMALDYADEGIRVNCVCPGIIDTSLLREAAAIEAANNPAAQIKTWGAMQPLGRLGTADEVAQTILFLAGPRSAFVTGAVYTIDGGLSASYGQGGKR